MARITLNIVGGLLAGLGAVWFLQGINVFMTGQIQWAVYGSVAVAVGIGVRIGANRSSPQVHRQ